MAKQMKWFIVICTVIAVLSLIASQTHLGECTSGSLQGIRYALFIKSSDIKRGDIVCLKGHTMKYAQGNKTLAKLVLGLPGDRIFRCGRNQLSVISHQNGEEGRKKSPVQTTHTLPLLKRTRKGEPLTPLSVRTIPEGHIFVAGDHPRSFDSRYEEFGLVPIEKVWGKALLWW